MKAISIPFASNSAHNSNIQQKITKKSRQELIVQINIGKLSQTNELHLSDINNMNYIDTQIKLFIKEHGLKEVAFGYIKEVIMKQIGQRKEQIYRECHSKCSKNCKCQNKMQNFQMKEKRILGVISLTTHSKTSQTRSLQARPKMEPQHFSIKITPNPAFDINTKPDKSPLHNTNRSNVISISGRQRQSNQALNGIIEEQRIGSNSFQDYLKNPQVICLEQASFSQNRPMITQPLSKENNIGRSFSGRRNGKIISTRERKEAIMTPQKIKLKQSNTSQVFLSAHSSYVRDQKRNLTQKNSMIIQKILQSPLFPDSCIPQGFQSIISGLFTKLTQLNPPGINEVHFQFVSYQRLQRQELQLMGILFQKINHTQLNHLNYDNFRSNALKYCWKELQQLVRLQENCSI